MRKRNKKTKLGCFATLGIILQALLSLSSVALKCRIQKKIFVIASFTIGMLFRFSILVLFLALYWWTKTTIWPFYCKKKTCLKYFDTVLEVAFIIIFFANGNLKILCELFTWEPNSNTYWYKKTRYVLDS